MHPSYSLATHLARNLFAGIIFIALALYAGMCGYHFLEGMSWVDAYENAAMILSGMGPVTKLQHTNAKIFAGCYALFSGLAFIAVMAVVFSPVIHQFFRRIHIESRKEETSQQ